MTMIFLDTEFNGFGGELISLGLCTEDEQIWYGVLSPLPEKIHPWVETNVIPHLGQQRMTRDEFRLSMFTFLRKFRDPVIVADWYSDLLHFFSLFAGERHETSVFFPCNTMLLPNGPNMDTNPDIPHNALSDAIYLKRWCMGL